MVSPRTPTSFPLRAQPEAPLRGAEHPVTRAGNQPMRNHNARDRIHGAAVATWRGTAFAGEATPPSGVASPQVRLASMAFGSVGQPGAERHFGDQIPGPQLFGHL